MKKLNVLSLLFAVAAIILMQTGCAEEPENNQNPDVTASSDTIYGILKYRQTDNTGIKLVDWHFGPGMLRVIINGQTLATTALQSDGNFMVILPGTVSGNHFTNMSDIVIIYGGTIEVSPETANYVSTTQFMVDYTENNEAKSITVSQALLNFDLTTYRNYYYYFYDNPGTVAGTGTAGNVFNWKFNKGWGIVESNMSTGATYIVSSKSVSTASANAVWSN
jgi:hypothetical protein